eukprot:CAMPEP_0202807956 /NCGR_PEP_ID=MMETSP1389-20130828/582_1 /ASSEMBLY_ACC=CAM_ASM_000865 /TAXON_ID=302021 /ORGANISM="Rhodomonas sp., Strain CCMP768" /LENGTH=271 /DNA_ID=CAMNT_0049478115 /DNA_START=72 /DNA_END=887 /DNA_ORIENTATION=-
MNTPPAPQFILPNTSFPLNNAFLPNTQLLLNQLGGLSGLNILGLQQQLCALPQQQQPTVPNLSAISVDITSQAKRKVEHAELCDNPAQSKSQRASSEELPVSSTADVDLVQKLMKEREDLSKALKASNEEVLRLREVVAQIVDGDQRTKSEDDTDDSGQAQRRYWNEDEHQRFLEGLEKYGPKSVKAIAEFVGTRTATQVRTHAQKYYQKLARMRKTDSKASGDELSGANTEELELELEQGSEGDKKEKRSESPEGPPPPARKTKDKDTRP